MTTEASANDIPSLLNHRLGAEEVVEIYRIALGRQPESPSVIDTHMRTHRTIADFLAAVLDSPEFRGRQRNLIAHHLAMRIDVDGTPEQIEQLLAHAKAVWADYGENDAHWSVLTHDAFKRETFDSATEECFYATGADDADVLPTLATRHNLDLAVGGRILDLGCGVGRVGEHLSKLFAHYDGVDISASHLALAADRFDKQGISNARLRTLAEYVDATDVYDVVYSILVLQHNPPPVTVFLLDRLMRSLRPGGIGFFQVPCALAEYEFDLTTYLEQMSDITDMEMHAVPMHTVLDTITRQGCELIESLDDGRHTAKSRSYAFLVRKDAGGASS